MDQCVRDRFAKCFRWEVKFVDHRPALADLNNTEFTFKPLHDPIDQLTDRALDMNTPLACTTGITGTWTAHTCHASDRAPRRRLISKQKPASKCGGSVIGTDSEPPERRVATLGLPPVQVDNGTPRKLGTFGSRSATVVSLASCSKDVVNLSSGELHVAVPYTDKRRELHMPVLRKMARLL